MPTPAAPYDRAAARPRPSKKPPAATTGMSTASRTVGSRSVVGTGPVWPPPSPPCTITASAPHAATFTACLAAPIDGITTMSCSLSVAISSGFGARANDATFTPYSIRSWQRAGASAASARRLTPKGSSVRPLTSMIACSSSAKVIVAPARIPRPPALAVPLTRRGPETQPMPVWTTGCRTPTRSVNGVRISCSLMRHLLEPQALRVEHLADLVDTHARMHAEEPDAVVGALDVEDAEIADDPVDVVVASCGRAGLLGQL